MGSQLSVEVAWRKWRLERMRRGMVYGIWICLTLYPLFGLLDLLIVPKQTLPITLGIRVVMFVLTLVMYWLLRTSLFLRHSDLFSGGYLVFAGSGIACMVFVFGGFQSPYYAGLNLTMVAGGALFPWPLRVSMLVNSLLVLAYVGPNAIGATHEDWIAAATHLPFLISTAIIAIAAQVLAYRSGRQQVEVQVELEEARTQERGARTELEQAYTQLEQLDRAKSDFFANISHELRTPLTIILANTDRMLEQALSEGRSTARVEAISRSALRLLNLINDLLDLTKLGATELPISSKAVDVGALCRRLAEDVQPLATQKGIVLQARVQNTAWYWLDPQHLEKIVFNLLSNALKFTPSGGHVALEVWQDDSGLHLSVSDDGIGIAEELHQTIFDRFSQASSSATRSYGGTGIGLALVAELSGSLGGTVSLDSSEGEGARFTVSFPRKLVVEPSVIGLDELPRERSLPREAAYASLQHNAMPVQTIRAGRRGPTLLLAEDDPDLQQELMDILSAEYRVVAVGDGQQALNLALKERPHVILADVMMPKMSGVELTLALRERPVMKNTPVVLLTARGELDDRVKGRQAGIDSYLTKPFHRRELIATIEGVLRSRMITVGDYLIHKKLGGGAQGEVYLAQHRVREELVALKVLLGSSKDEAAERKRLQRERDALTRLRHPNIVSILDQGVLDGVSPSRSHYLVMEYLQGSTVAQVLEASGRLPAGSAVAIARAVAYALSAVHEAGVVHRDIKGQNVLIVAGEEPLTERVRLIDFGLAHEISAPKDIGAGSLAYAAPEVVSGATPSAASDLYSLGVFLFEMCTGALPYSGSTRDELIAKIQEQPTPEVSTYGVNLPIELTTVISQAMHKEPAKRWSSAAAFHEALKRVKLPESPVTEFAMSDSISVLKRTFADRSCEA